MAATATAPEQTNESITEPGRGPLGALGLPPAPEPRRRNVMMVGTFFGIAAGTMLIGAVLGGYFAMRETAEAAGQGWRPEEVRIPNVPVLLAYGTLLMSSVTAQWSVAAIRIGARQQMYVAIGLTLLLGLSFVNALSFVWSYLGLVAGETAYSTAVYMVSVTHLVIVVVAHVLFLVMGFRALGGQFTPRNSEFVQAAASFWHFAALAGVVVWWFLWFLEGGPG
jgi:heme/copper-type cytochrome/quinol oxidase subunit 3